MAYNYSVDEKTIPRKYVEHDWSNNVIISDKRMTSIEKGIVNLYNTIFGVEEKIGENGETQVEKITSIFDDFKDTVIGDDLSGPHNGKIFDNIAKLWHNIEDVNNVNGQGEIISKTPYGKIVDLITRLGISDKSSTDTAFGRIKSIDDIIGTIPPENENTIFEHITTLETNLGPSAQDSTNKNTAFDRIANLETRLGPAPQDEENKNTAFDQITTLTNSLGTQGTNQSAFTEINAIKSNLGDKGNNNQVFNEIESAKGRINTLETKIGPIPQDEENKNTILYRMATLETDLENRVTSILDNSLRIPLSYQIANLLTEEKEYKIRLLDINYPIGSIYMTLNNADPANILGGKWIPISQGRVLIGAGTDISDGTTTKSFAAGSTGGEYNHKLLVDEMPAHNHDVYFSYTKGTETGSALTMSTKVKRKNASDVVINKGRNIGHNNIQPYLVCNIWQRVIEDIHDVMRAMDNGTYTYLFKVDNEIPLILNDKTTIIMIIDQIDTENNYVYFRQKYTNGMTTCSNSEINDKLTNFQNSIPNDIKLALVGNPTLPEVTTLDGVEVWATSNQGDTEAQHYLLPRICLKTIDMGVSSNIVDAEDSGHSF